MKGFINVLKPSGVSSAYAVGVVKRKVNCPCGHMGTLDPMASGVLPVGIDKTSRLFPFLLEKKKTYVARFLFGKTTDTLDITGTITGQTDIVPTEEQLQNVIKKFVGKIAQVPPKYSAKCINGKRGYELSRKGVDFTLEAKNVVIDSITLNAKTGENEYEFTICCGGGTYIRSLARDIAFSCNSLGVMTKLERIKSGVFTLENGVDLETLKNSDSIEQFLLPADIAVDFPKLVLTSAQAQKILDGVYLDYGFTDGVYRVYNEDDFWGIAKVEDGVVRIKPYVR